MWLKAMAPDTSNQTRKDEVVEVLAGPQATSDPPVTRAQCEEHIKRNGADETEPVFGNSWSDFAASRPSSVQLGEGPGAPKPKAEKLENAKQDIKHDGHEDDAAAKNNTNSAIVINSSPPHEDLANLDDFANSDDEDDIPDVEGVKPWALNSPKTRHFPR